jgi:hypothetical protein
MEKKLVIFGHHWSTKKIFISALWGFGFLACSLLLNYFAGTYASAHVSNPVNDIILDNLPAKDVDGIFIYGIFIFFIFIFALCIHSPRRTPFILKSMSIFIAIRSFFIILTHIAPSLHQIPMDIQSRVVNIFTFTGDLFFSGHTGMPFLMALIFWKNQILRSVFISTSFFFGFIVLLGHLHYSIDVFSAFFITYGIFQISKWIFEKDYQLLNSLHTKEAK